LRAPPILAIPAIFTQLLARLAKVSALLANVAAIATAAGVFQILALFAHFLAITPDLTARLRRGHAGNSNGGHQSQQNILTHYTLLVSDLPAGRFER
jgi:hypothetical protein